MNTRQLCVVWGITDCFYTPHYSFIFDDKPYCVTTHTENFPLLHTPRLCLKEVQQGHRAALYDLFTNPQVKEHYPVIPLQEEADAQKIIDMFRRVYAEKTGLRWVISLEGEEDVIGIIGYNTYTHGHKGTIVYAIAPQYWGKGLITEAIEAIVNYGFQQLELNRIEAEVIPGNAGSEKVLEKNGFKYEGLLRQWMHWGGKYYDVNMYARVRAT